MPAIVGDQIACKDAVALQGLFSRLKKEELIDLWTSWHMHELDVPENITKKKLVQQGVHQLFAHGITYNQIADLELTYYRARPLTRKWTVLQLVYPTQDRDVAQVQDPSSFQSRLEIELGRYFECHTRVQQVSGQLWIRIGMYDDVPKGTLPSSTNSTFIVYYPHSTYVFVSALKQEHSEFIFKGLAVGLQCEDVCDPGSLESHDVQSLADLMLYPTSQGPYRTARLEAMSDNPLTLILGREGGEKEVSKATPGIICEDPTVYESRNKRVHNVFGDHDHPQPALDHIYIQVKTGTKRQKAGAEKEIQKEQDEGQEKEKEIQKEKRKEGKTKEKERKEKEKDEVQDKNKDKETDEHYKIEMSITLAGTNVLEGLKLLTRSGGVEELHSSILKNMWKTNRMTIYQ